MERNVTKRNERRTNTVYVCFYHKWYQPVFELCILVSATTQFSFWCAVPCMFISPIRRSCVRLLARLHTLSVYWFVFFWFSLLFHLSFSPLFYSLSPHSHTRSFVCMYALFSFSLSTTVFICKHHTRKRTAFVRGQCGRDDQYSIWMDFGCAALGSFRVVLAVYIRTIDTHKNQSQRGSKLRFRKFRRCH